MECARANRVHSSGYTYTRITRGTYQPPVAIFKGDIDSLLKKCRQRDLCLMKAYSMYVKDSHPSDATVTVKMGVLSQIE
jgi:hypothetical protein